MSGSGGAPRHSGAMVSIERLRSLFRDFAANQCRGRSAVYETLSDGIARDDGLLELAMVAPPEQRRPSLLFGAVNSLLANDPTAELRCYYPIHGGDRPVDDGLSSAFADFCLQHRDALTDLLAHRSTQTNEVRRCVALRLGINEVARRWPGPLSLVEVGASAGLNLIFDRYSYRIDGRAIDGVDSAVVVSSELRGPALQLSYDVGRTPMIIRRLGIDQDPVDLADEGARRWLEAFIWPEQVTELATLRAAIETYLAGAAGVELVQGDAVTDSARMILEQPGDEPVIMFTASLMSYLSLEERRDFAGQLDLIARQRRVAWVFAEAAGLLGPMGVRATGLDGPLSEASTVYAVGVSTRDRTGQDDRILAVADPYLRWIAPARTVDDTFAWGGYG